MYLGLTFFTDISCHKTGASLISCPYVLLRLSPLCTQPQLDTPASQGPRPNTGSAGGCVCGLLVHTVTIPKNDQQTTRPDTRNSCVQLTLTSNFKILRDYFIVSNQSFSCKHLSTKW